MTMNRHEPFEELISASLHGDLTGEERARLDAHLDTCAACRATLAAFADQRRIIAGVRHVPVPRDLEARVRSGVEVGSLIGLPWGRRPAAIFAGVGGGLAIVAGSLLALVLLSGSPDEAQVGRSSPSISASDLVASATPVPTPPPIVVPAASPTPVESSSAAPAATAAATPIPASPEPDVYLAVTGPADNQAITIRDGTTGDTIREVDAPFAGPPIAAELSPDGRWLAYITQVGESGNNEVRATPLPDGETVVLGQSIAGSPFLEHLFWSSDSEYLAYTLADVDGGGTDVSLFHPDTGQRHLLTDTGDSYAGSWTFDDSHGSLLWVSRAAETPRSYLLSSASAGGSPVDPGDSPYPHATNVFQPIVSPNGSLVIFWQGRMVQSGDEWLFGEGGEPWIAENRGDGDGGFTFDQVQEIFTDLTVGREAFASAAITWGLDSDAFAVWAAQWTGVSQGRNGRLYPDEEDVYLGYATDRRHITQTHALDADDIPDGARAVDVKVAASGRHLVITVAYSRGGVLDPPVAELRLITRNTGSVADEVKRLASGDDDWFGPAAFDGSTGGEAP